MNKIHKNIDVVKSYHFAKTIIETMEEIDNTGIFIKHPCDPDIGMDCQICFVNNKLIINLVNQ